MILAAMRYKGYIWPHNPRTYTIDYGRKVALHKIPFGGYRLQDLGLTRRVMKGEGEFVGPGAYEEFRKLASIFYDPGPGPLLHPVWQASEAFFVDLSLRQEPRADYVRYSFTFWESGEGQEDTMKRVEDTPAPGGGGDGGEARGEYHTVQAGETLWGIARRYGADLNAIIGLNPQIKNPNLILPGEKVRVK